jgi:hypothetical protein
MKELKKPKEWPGGVGMLFGSCTKLTVSELLLHAGPVGAYCFQFLDIDSAIKADMIMVLRLMGLVLRKTSTPGDRLKLRKELAAAVTRLELALPVYIQTTVMHWIVFHMTNMLEATGPFHVSNQLDMERFQVVLKGCARAKRNVMQSIVNNFLLLEVSLNNRLTSSWDWTVCPAGSSTAAYLRQQDSANRKDRCWREKGKQTSLAFDDEVFQEVLKLWQLHEPAYEELCTRFEKEQRAFKGNKRRQYRVSDIADWRPQHNQLTAEQRRWISMTSQAKVSSVPRVLY